MLGLDVFSQWLLITYTFYILASLYEDAKNCLFSYSLVIGIGFFLSSFYYKEAYLDAFTVSSLMTVSLIFFGTLLADESTVENVVQLEEKRPFILCFTLPMIVFFCVDIFLTQFQLKEYEQSQIFLGFAFLWFPMINIFDRYFFGESEEDCWTMKDSFFKDMNTFVMFFVGAVVLLGIVNMVVPLSVFTTGGLILGFLVSGFFLNKNKWLFSFIFIWEISIAIFFQEPKLATRFIVALFLTFFFCMMVRFYRILKEGASETEVVVE